MLGYCHTGRATLKIPLGLDTDLNGSVVASSKGSTHPDSKCQSYGIIMTMLMVDLPPHTFTSTNRTYPQYCNFVSFALQDAPSFVRHLSTLGRYYSK